MDFSQNSDKLVLVTGINGYMGSQIAAQFLEKGFKVRGTVRNLSKGLNIKRVLEGKYGDSEVELVEVEDINIEGTFDEAVKGVYAISYTASITSISPDPEKVIAQVVASVLSILNSALAHAQPTLRHFVYTSSSAAAVRAVADVPRDVTSNTWNDLDMTEAWMPETRRQNGHGWIVYGASKAMAEKALWDWVKDKEVGFSVNAILPATCIGPVLCKEEASSTGPMIREVYEGRLEHVLGVAPQHFVSIEDTARLHVAPVLFPDVRNQRLFAWNAPYNWNSVLHVLREVRPEKKFQDDVQGLGEDLTTVENGDAEALLKRMGRDGWVGLRECIVGNLESLGL